MRLRTLLFWIVVLLTLLPSLAVTAARFLQPDSEISVRLVAFAPLVLPLYAVAFVLLLGRIPFGERWVGWAFGAGLAAALIAVHVWWISPQFLGAAPPPAAGSVPFRVMTANVGAGTDAALAAVQRAGAHDIDVLVVEEITPGVQATMVKGGLGTLYAFSAGEPGSGVEGTMVFSRFPLGTAERLDTELGSWVVTLSAPDGDVRLLALHVSPPTDADAWHADHQAIRDYLGDEEVDLVVGDFNATPDHLPMLRLEEAGYRSANELQNQGWQPTWPSNGGWSVAGYGLPPLFAIDHVLVGPDLAVTESSREHLDQSDHQVVLAEVAAK